MNEQIEALNTANEYLDNLKNGIKEVVLYIENEEEEKACSMIPLIADGIDWIMKVVNLTSDVHKGRIQLNGIEDKINELADALENEDYILVGDLFHYEILPVLEKAHDDIKEVILN